MFLRKGILKICSEFTEETPCRSAISIKLLCNFIEIALRHGCSPVNLLHIFRTPFSRNTTGCLLLNLILIRENLLFYYLSASSSSKYHSLMNQNPKYNEKTTNSCSSVSRIRSNLFKKTIF